MIEKLALFVSSPIPYDKISTKHDLGFFPESYRTFIAGLLGLNILNSDSGSNLDTLKAKVQGLLRSPDFMRIISLYGEITDTKIFADQLLENAKKLQ